MRADAWTPIGSVELTESPDTCLTSRLVSWFQEAALSDSCATAIDLVDEGSEKAALLPGVGLPKLLCLDEGNTVRVASLLASHA